MAAPNSQDLLVVEAVLRAANPQQYVLLHRSLEGTLVRGEPGAVVSVVTPDGTRVDYEEAPQNRCFAAPSSRWVIGSAALEATCYVSPESAGFFVRPGATYDLLVSTVGGEIARGRTTLPSSIAFRAPDVAVHPVTRQRVCRLPNDPFELIWTRAEGAWSYLIGVELRGWGQALREEGIEFPEPLELVGVSVSAADTTLLFPENVGLFQRGDLDQRVLLRLQEGLDDATVATVTILATDRNFTNAIRGGRFNPSGNVRGSSIVGDGVGVFGSVVPITIRSPLVAPSGGPPPPCPLPA